MTQNTDEQLMQQYGQGDIAAFTLLYEKHKGGLYRYFVRQTQDTQLAQDLYQDVWNKVIDSAKTYQPTAKFTTWVYTLAHRKLIDHVRHLKVVENVIVKQPDETDELPVNRQCDITIVEDVRAGEALKRCLNDLPQMQLDSFLLREEAGLGAADIANIVGSGLEATKSRLRYAYKSLRDCISQKVGKVVA